MCQNTTKFRRVSSFGFCFKVSNSFDQINFVVYTIDRLRGDVTLLSPWQSTFRTTSERLNPTTLLLISIFTSYSLHPTSRSLRFPSPKVTGFCLVSPHITWFRINPDRHHEVFEVRTPPSYILGYLSSKLFSRDRSPTIVTTVMSSNQFSTGSTTLMFVHSLSQNHWFFDCPITPSVFVFVPQNCVIIVVYGK